MQSIQKVEGCHCLYRYIEKSLFKIYSITCVCDENHYTRELMIVCTIANVGVSIISQAFINVKPGVTFKYILFIIENVVESLISLEKIYFKFNQLSWYNTDLKRQVEADFWMLY